MKKLILLFTILTLSGCFFNESKSISISAINQCITENKSFGLDATVENCKNLCNDNMACEKRVIVIAEEKISQKSKVKSLKSDVAEILETGNEKLEIGDDSVKDKDEEPEPTISNDVSTSLKASSDEEETTATNNLVTLAGVACDNKENLPAKMKVWAERVDKVYWYWMVPISGAWEFTELEAGQYKIYYAPERKTEPLAKYSELVADGVGGHDYKVLDLSDGGEVRGIRPCDWGE